VQIEPCGVLRVHVQIEPCFSGAAPTRAAPLNTAYFWIEDSSRNRLALNGISDSDLNRFFEKNSNIFFTFFFPSENGLKRMLKKSYHRLFLGGGGARFLAPVQEASTAVKEFFWLSEFCTCLTDLLCLTTTPFPIFPNSRVDWHTLHLKLCLLADLQTAMTGTWGHFSILY